MPAADLPLLVATVGARRLALRAGDVAAVLPLPRLTRPPSTPAPVLGFADVGGRAVAVIAPLALLEAAATPPPGIYSHLILLKRGEPVALLVDRVLDHRLVPAASLRPVPADESANGCVVGLIGEGEETAHLLSADRLLIEAERQRIGALATQLDERRGAFAS